MSFLSAVAGQPMKATQVTQFANWITGSKVDTDGNITTTSPTTYSMTVTNQDTSAGLVLKLVYGATTIGTFNKTGASITVPLVATGLALFSSTGQLLYGAGGTATGLLAKGGVPFAELVMNAGATAPTWATGVLATIAAAGDLVYGSGTNAVARLALGTATTVLVGGSTAPAWGQVADAQIAAAAGIAVTKLAAGTDAQYLRTSGATAVWQTVSAAATVDKITEAILTTVAAQILFTGVSTAYRHLRLVWQGRSDATAATVTPFMQFNGDTGATYDYQHIFGSVTAVAALEVVTSVGLSIGLSPGGGAVAGAFGGGAVDFPMYAGTVSHKFVVGDCAAKQTAVSGGMVRYVVSGHWRSTTAVTQVRLFLSAGSWIAGSVFTLYGSP